MGEEKRMKRIIAALVGLFLPLMLIAPAGASHWAGPDKRLSAADHEDCYHESKRVGPDLYICLHVYVLKDADGIGYTLSGVEILTSDMYSNTFDGWDLYCWNEDGVVRWQKTDANASPYANINLGRGDDKWWTPDQRWGGAADMWCQYRGTGAAVSSSSGYVYLQIHFGTPL